MTKQKLTYKTTMSMTIVLTYKLNVNITYIEIVMNILPWTLVGACQ